MGTVHGRRICDGSRTLLAEKGRDFPDFPDWGAYKEGIKERPSGAQYTYFLVGRPGLFSTRNHDCNEQTRVPLWISDNGRNSFHDAPRVVGAITDCASAAGFPSSLRLAPVDQEAHGLGPPGRPAVARLRAGPIDRDDGQSGCRESLHLVYDAWNHVLG